MGNPLITLSPVIPAWRRFRVAFSFAGEKRGYVAEIAEILAGRFSRESILYDRYHEAEFAHPNLAFTLPELYRSEADLVVAVFCPDYERKEWCGLEWRAIFGLIKEGKEKPIMLLRFGLVDGKGLHGLAGFIDLDSRTPEQAAALILERLVLNERVDSVRHVEIPPDRPPLPPATNVLPRLPYFFGREKELKTIADALAPEARTWGALIDGPGGIGKTSLAIRAAELSPAGRFEKTIFLSAKERELTADGQRVLTGFVLPSYLQMLNELAAQLGRPELAKLPEDERARRIHEVLQGERALLILDNLESLEPAHRDLLFAFLSRLPHGCKAIVTSRRRTDVDARIIRLEKLDQKAALDLLETLSNDRPLLAKATATEQIQLYEETGGNPLLLRWVAGQLGKGRCRTINSALELLRGAPEGNDPLEFIFGDLLETFTESETQVLAALSHFTGAMEVKFIAELGGISKTAAQTALEDLSSRALVVPDDREENFVLVPTVADFLRRKRPEVVEVTGNRLEQHAYALIVENGRMQHDRFSVLDAAWPSVVPALPRFLAGSNARLQTVCAALDVFLNFTGRWDESLSLNQKSEARAVDAGDFYNAGWRAYNTGWIHSLRQEADMVLACADRAAAHWGDEVSWDKSVHPRGNSSVAGTYERSFTVRLRGHGYKLKKDYRAAIAAYREALGLSLSLSAVSVDVACAWNDLAVAKVGLGDLAAAESDYRESLQIVRAIGFTEGLAATTVNLVELALARKDWTTAETLAREALTASEDVGRQELIATVCHRLAQALVPLGLVAEALPHARRAVGLYTRLGSPDLAEAQATLRQCQRAYALERLNHGWTYNTTTLEGNTLTLSEVGQALADPAATFAARPAEHVATTRSQGAALKLLGELLELERHWSVEDLFRLHTVLMQGSTVDCLKPVGAWKLEDNGAPVKLDGKGVWNDAYAAADHVRVLMDNWITELNRRREGKEDVLADHVWLHATFVRIHPFADGNGRMARMLANLPLIAAGQDPVDIPATARDRYLEALARWQIACGPPRPGAPLYEKDELLADFKALCASSRPSD